MDPPPQHGWTCWPNRRDARDGRQRLPFAVRNAAFGQIVGREFHADAVARYNTDEVLAHPTRNVGGHKVSTFDFDTKSGIGQRLGYGALHFEGLFFLFRHISLHVPCRCKGLR